MIQHAGPDAMSGIAPRLDNPPIVEAVVDIDCDLSVSHDLEAVAERAKAAFAPEYPLIKKRFIQAHQLTVGPESGQVVSSTSGLDAVHFLEKGERQLVQVRKAGYSFNRLAPYTSFDEYLPEIARTWRLYQEVASPSRVRRVRLRYINRILLPTVDGVVDLRHYLSVGPELPDRNAFTLTGFLDQHSAVERATGNLINTVLAGQPQEGDKVPIIFDNGVEAELSAEPSNWTVIDAKLRDLRRLKNKIFALTLDPKCLNLFLRSSDSE